MRTVVAVCAALALAGCNTATLTYPPDNLADADLDACYFYCGDGGDAARPAEDGGSDAPATDATQPADAPPADAPPADAPAPADATDAAAAG
jgi:hypothetical protein